jgi:hypothetical protein
VGGRNIPHYIFIEKKTMKIEKKLIKESLGYKEGKKTFSKKKQNIIITESQLEKLLEKLKK